MPTGRAELPTMSLRSLRTQGPRERVRRRVPAAPLELHGGLRVSALDAVHLRERAVVAAIVLAAVLALRIVLTITHESVRALVAAERLADLPRRAALDRELRVVLLRSVSTRPSALAAHVLGAVGLTNPWRLALERARELSILACVRRLSSDEFFQEPSDRPPRAPPSSTRILRRA